MIMRLLIIIVFLGIPSLGFALVSGLFNAAYAARFGQDAQERMTWIAASILITCFVTGLPLAIEVLRARVPHLALAARALWVAGVAFSFVAAMGYAAVTRGQVTAEADTRLKDRAGIERSIARSEAELGALPQHRPARAVEADLRLAETAVGRAWAWSGECRAVKDRWQRHACRPVLELRRELAAAEEAQRIEGKLADLRRQRDGLATVGVSANPQADVLSWMGGRLLAPDVWERVLTVFVAALIEMSAALGLAITARAAVELMGDRRDRSAPRPPRSPRPEAVAKAVPAVVAHIPATAPEDGWRTWFEECVAAQRGARVTPKEAFNHYEAWAARRGGGTLPYVTFGRRMSEAIPALGGKSGRGASRYYDGIALSGGDVQASREAGE
jgi:hypothetical protein